MSAMEFKVVLRIYDENISSKREHLQWMREEVGEEPVWVEGEDSDDEADFCFSYQRMNEDGTRRQHTSGQPPYFAAVDGGDLYGVDLVLVHTVGELPMASIHMRDMDRALSTMCNRTGVNADHVRYLFYAWHNGGDEPIEW